LSFSLLTDSVFSLRIHGDAPSKGFRASLPGVLACLSSGDHLDFAALQPHQRHAWESFLVQLAAIAVHRDKAAALPSTYTDWKDALFRLVDGEGDAFHLVIEDLSKPAFLQCPTNSIAAWDVFPCPDTIDVPVTTKNHDYKTSRMFFASPEHWVYSLVSTQTMQGFWGRGHYGIARMNSGVGSRPLVTMSRSEDSSVRFRRDVRVLLKCREDIAKGRYKFKDGLALLWLYPWSGNRTLELNDLDPFFIETCARIRLTHTDSHISACMTHVNAAHVRIEKGDTGDVWTPIRREDRAALTVKKTGFSYDTVCDLLWSEKWEPSPASAYRPEDGGTPVLVFQALARGQGKTEGFHYRTLRIEGQALELYRTPEGRDALRIATEARVNAVQQVRLKVLKPALLCLVQGAPDRLNFEDNRVEVCLADFRSAVEEIFFEELFKEPVNRGIEEWNALLVRLAAGVLKDGMDALPIPQARRDQAIAGAWRTFCGSSYNLFAISGDSRESTELSPAENRAQVKINLIAHALVYQTSAEDLGWLRRLRTEDVESPQFALLYERFIHHRSDPPNLATDRRWAVIIRAMACLAGLHRPYIPLGKAMVRAQVEISRARVLLTARGEDLERVVNVLARQFSQRGTSVNHRDIAELILSDGHDQSICETSWSTKVRRRVARDFYASV
jgi:CRISPR system Cascade subunit CasA